MSSRAAGLLLAATCAAALSGCALFTPPSFEPGSSPGDVMRQMGQPTNDYPRPEGGHVMEYATGPFGKFTYLVTFDSNDRLVSGEQVLTEKRFNQIKAGMTADEVRRFIGRPGSTFGVHYPKEIVWSYRYDTPFCQWFMVGMGYDDKVIDTSYGPDPACERNGRLFGGPGA